MFVKFIALKQLIEAAVQPQNAGAQGTAILVLKSGEDVSVVAYDPSKLIDDVLQGVNDGDDSFETLEKNGTPAIVGIVSMHPANEMMDGKCHGSYIVQAAAARKGYGPMIYDLALSLGRPVTSDRHNVSGDAKKVWDKYMSRGDVKKLPFDDIEDPKTDDPDDDCLIHKGIDSLNNAYVKGGGDSPYSSMISNDKRALASYNAALKKLNTEPLTMDDWHDGIILAAADYFTIKYATNVTHKKKEKRAS